MSLPAEGERRRRRRSRDQARRPISVERWAFWIATALAGVAVVLAVANAVLTRDNRAMQAEINQRQQFINQSIQLSRINEALAKALASAAAGSNDPAIRDLLLQHGIRYEASPAPATPPGPAAK